MPDLADHWQKDNVQLEAVLPNGMLTLFSQWFGLESAMGFTQMIHEHKYIGMIAIVLATCNQLRTSGIFDRDFEGTLGWFHREMRERSAKRPNWPQRVRMEAETK